MQARKKSVAIAVQARLDNAAANKTMKPTKIVQTLAACGCLIGLATGCASMICGSQQKVSIASLPPGAEVMVYGDDGSVLLKDTTPCVAKLKRRAKTTLEGAQYTVLVRKEGFAPVQVPLEGVVNRAYFINVVNVVGLFIDPVTGGMWTLSPGNVSAELVKENAAFFNHKDGVLICLKEQAPAALVPYLQPYRN
jgi:hypothetical protein